MKNIHLVVALTSFSVLTACGGGGSTVSSTSSGNNTADTPTDRPLFARALITESPSYSPSGEITDRTPTFSWKAIAGATDYFFGHENTADAQGWHDYKTTPSEAGCPNVGDICEFTPTDYTFERGVEKAWWVRAKINGHWQDWSRPNVFTVVDDINNNVGVPVPGTPVGTINNQNPQFSWVGVSGANAYKIGYEETNTWEGWNELIVTSQDAQCQASQDCVFTIPQTQFPYGSEISWWVKARVNTTWSEWSEGRDFTVSQNTTITDKPTPLSPLGTINTLTPEFSWTAVNGATDYKLGYKNTSAQGTWKEQDFSAEESHCATANTCRLRLADPFFSGEQVNWWVKAKVNGEWQYWSETGNFTIGQNQSERPFVFKVDIQPGNSTNPENYLKKQFSLITNGSGYDYNVDCDSDGILEGTHLTGDFVCAYDDYGKYTVIITGKYPEIHGLGPYNKYGFPNTMQGKSGLRSIEILQWGSNKWRSLDKAFITLHPSNFHTVISSATDSPDLSQLKSMKDFIIGIDDRALKLDSWNTSHISDMSLAFSNSSTATISNWDVSNVVNMSEMFKGALVTADLSNWDVSNVTDMSLMFNRASLTADLSNWDVSNVTDMHAMFDAAEYFNGNIGHWNVSKVKDMNMMFRDAKRFNQDIGSWDVSNVTSMIGMFSSRTIISGNSPFTGSFNQDIGNWNVSNVTNMSGMFFKNIAFNQDIGNWDVSNVTKMIDMFAGAQKFNQDISNWNVSNVTSMENMFGTNRHGMYLVASNFNQDIGNWDVSNATNMRYMFAGNKAFNQDISSWDVSNVKNLQLFDKDENDLSFSTQNYDKLLLAWSQLNLQHNVTLSVGKVKYTQAAASARQKLIDDFGWTIHDGGQL